MSSQSAPIASLRGAAASIFLVMVLDPVPQTIKSLEEASGYTYKPVRAALDHLIEEGLVYHDELRGYWQLQPHTPLLWRLQETAPVAGEHFPAGYSVAEDSTAHPAPVSELSTGRPSPEKTPLTNGEKPASPGETPLPAARSAPPAIDKQAVPIGDSPRHHGKSPYHGHDPAAAQNGLNSPADAEDSMPDGETPPQNGLNPSSRAHFPAAAANTGSPSTENKAASMHPPQTRSRPPKLDHKQRLLQAWLIQGGVGPGSPKMDQLLSQDLAVHTVKAHVLERLACEQGLISDTPSYSVGLLIRKLLDGDPAPPLRCEKCLQLPGRQGLCRCDYDHLIKR